MHKTTFGKLMRGDQFIGDPHGGWIFIKTDRPNIGIRIADGGTINWKDDAAVLMKREDKC